MAERFFGIRTLVKIGLVAVAVAALQACAAPYDVRMKHLDLTAQRGLDYRAKLLKQGTQPSKSACATGWGFVQDNPPNDGDGGGETEEWHTQIAEAFIKSCMTGEPRPRPEPSGVDAVTAVPGAPASPAVAVTPAGR